MTTLITEVYDAFKDAGASEANARKAAEAMLSALHGQSATKADLAEIRTQIAETKGEMIKWMVGIAFAQIAATLGLIKLFIH